jgi:drug/metabolite transporter (DMT)-like permease
LKKHTIVSHIALLCANFIYGANYVIAKGIMPDYFPPRAIVFIRIFGALILFWLFGLFTKKEKVNRKDLFKLAFCAVFGVALNQTIFFEGLNLTTPINSSIIMTINPILVLVFSYFIIKDKITLYKIIGIVAGGGGAALLILNQGNVSFSSDTFVGNLFIVVNASSFALYLVLIKPLMIKYSPWTILKWIFLFGFIYILPFSLHKIYSTDFNSIPNTAWFSILYIVLGPTFLGYLLYNFALKRISPLIAGTYIYLQPLFASIIAISIGQDVLSFNAILSAILIFAGVYFVSAKTDRQ